MLLNLIHILIQIKISYLLFGNILHFEQGTTLWLTSLCYLFIVLNGIITLTITILFKLNSLVNCLNVSYKIMYIMDINYKKFKFSSVISLLLFSIFVLIKFYISVIHYKLFDWETFFFVNSQMFIINCYQSITLTLLNIAEIGYMKINKQLMFLKVERSNIGCIGFKLQNNLIDLMKYHSKINSFVLLISNSFGLQLFFGVLSLILYVFSVLYTFIYIIVFDRKNPLYIFWCVSNVINLIWSSEVIVRLSYASQKMHYAVSISIFALPIMLSTLIFCKLQKRILFFN